jgi:hypothetical protein
MLLEGEMVLEKNTYEEVVVVAYNSMSLYWLKSHLFQNALRHSDI